MKAIRCSVWATVLIWPGLCWAQRPVDFNRDVRPILSDRCIQCHGPDEHERQAELRLDQADGPEGAYRDLYGRPAIKPGSLQESELWHRIQSDGDDQMPPPDADKPPLSPEERDIIRRWIQEGAAYDVYWAFVPPRTPSLPEGDNASWSEQPIDRLVYQRLAEEGLRPQPAADRRTLIRRLSLDLIGLPPTRQEIEAFLADEGPGAYERLVDRLLARPQYGEHMAKYWLDLVRFADTNGMHHDHYREMTPYRDWVIRSFNENIPYDQFVTYQLAGDLYPEPTRDQLIASGFNRLHLIIDRGTALPQESFTRNVVDRVTAVGTAFLGLTLQCAMCHDHKYDPITGRDFYQMFAFFNNLDAEPETGGRDGTDFERGLQAPYINLTTDQQQAQLDQLTQEVSESQSRIQTLEQQVRRETEGVEKAGKTDNPQETQNSDEQDLASELEMSQATLKQLENRKAELELSIPAAMIMKERAEPRPSYILIRGEYDKFGEQVERGTPAFLPPLNPREALPTRMDLARWFVAPEHPLTARVAVNRFWQQIFGVGIVKTAEDFGAQGRHPSHPELLDYLAATFIESDWDVKALIKQIVMSQTYQQSSMTTPEQFRADPENRLLGRGSRYRLDAEVIRDQVLATSGLLNPAMYGKSVKPPQPEGLWKAVTMPYSYPRLFEADTGDNIYRRSLYTFWKRAMPPPQMSIFNAPTREECIARRERTNTPLQALLLLNEREYFKAARHLAGRALNEYPECADERLVVLYESITARLPDAEEVDTLTKMLDDLREIYRDAPRLAEQLCEGEPLPPEVSATELAAWTLLVNSLYNLDIVKTRD
jgi:hypothetical protein